MLQVHITCVSHAADANSTKFEAVFFCLDWVRSAFDSVENHMSATMKSETLSGVGGSLEGPSILMNSGMAALQKTVQKSRMPKATGDMLVYLALIALVWGAWWVTSLGLFDAGDDIGYWIGVAGGVMMVLLFSYPLRKRFRFTQRWGKAKWWFMVHMILGVGGPILILVHSAFQARSLNAAAAYYSMIIVALSGVVGRYIYSHVNRGLHGEQSDFQDLQQRAGLHQREAHSRLSFAPAVEQRLKEFGEHEMTARPNFLTCLRRVFWLPIKQWWTFRACAKEVQEPLNRLAVRGGWDEASLAKRQKLAKKLIRRYLNAVVRVAQFTAFERLFSLWHVAHIPFVYLLVISSIIHVIAVHAY